VHPKGDPFYPICLRFVFFRLHSLGDWHLPTIARCEFFKQVISVCLYFPFFSTGVLGLWVGFIFDFWFCYPLGFSLIFSWWSHHWSFGALGTMGFGISSFLFMLGFHRDLSNKLKITWIGGDLIPKSGFKHELWFVLPYVVSFCACILPVVDQGFFVAEVRFLVVFPIHLFMSNLCVFFHKFFSLQYCGFGFLWY
jgi:hypothetical protein